MDKPTILREDDDFFIEVNINGNPETTNGFLLRRCALTLTSPEGVECVGGYDREPSGRWNASISAPQDAITDSDAQPLGYFDTRDLAIEALWQARSNAYTRRPRH